MLNFLGANNQKDPSKTSEKSMNYESAVYWFRDYWSNRLGLKRNVNAERFDIDTEKGYLPGELTIENALTGKCNVKWASGQFEGLVEPFGLAHKYEPCSIRFPFNKSGIRDESPDPNYRIDSELVKKVIAMPLVQTSGEVKLWLRILLRVIIPSIIFLVIEALFLRYAAISNPELARFSLIVMAISIAVFLYSSLVVFVRIGVSESTRKILGAKATVYFYNGQQVEKFHYRYLGDIPNWLEAKPYWVFRYVFSWSLELSPSKGFPLIRAIRDIERLDVWLDAKSGIIEWIVSDYHWRELWYRAEPNLSNVSVWVLRNFHTLRPLNISIADKGTLSDLYSKGNPLSKEWLDNVAKYKSSHSDYFSKNNKTNKLGFGDRLLLSNLNDLWWEKWRYKYGANNAVYSEPSFAATGKQPNLSISTLPRQKTMTSETVTIPTVASSKRTAVPLVVTIKTAGNQIAKPAVKSIATKANIVIPVNVMTKSRQRTRASLYSGIAAAAIFATLLVGYLYGKKTEKTTANSKPNQHLKKQQ